MADKRPAYRRGTTGKQWQKFRASIIGAGTVCCICGNSKGPIVTDAPCQHPAHQHLKGCPTHPLAPSLEHPKALVHGGAARSKSNAKLSHFGCNARKGQADGQRRKAKRSSWDW